LNSQDKKIILYFISIFISFLSVIIYMNYQIGNPILPTEGTVKDSFVRTADVDKKEIFLTMADIRNYPNIIQGNYISVNIINDTNGTIYAEEEVQDMGIRTKMLVKHILVPYDKHIMTILDGDAKGSTITEIFEENGSYTRLTTNVDVHIHGILSPFASLTKSNLDSAVNTIILKFVEYTKNEHARYP